MNKKLLKFMTGMEGVELLRLVQEIVHGYGMKKMAGRLGLAYSTLANKLNPDMGEESRHHLSLREFLLIMDISGDYRPLHLICLDTSHIAVEIHHHPTDRADWLKLQAKSAHTHGQKADRVLNSLADGKLCRDTGCLISVLDCKCHAYDAAAADLEIYANLSDLERELKRKP